MCKELGGEFLESKITEELGCRVPMYYGEEMYVMIQEKEIGFLSRLMGVRLKEAKIPNTFERISISDSEDVQYFIDHQGNRTTEVTFTCTKDKCTLYLTLSEVWNKLTISKE